MSHAAPPLPAPQDFELVDARYFIVPVALWGLMAAFAVLVSLAAQPDEQRSAADEAPVTLIAA